MIFSPKKDVFFEMLSKISANLKESSQFFMDYKINNASDLKEFSGVMKEYETKGDTYIHELIVALNKTFITPIEREDILQLAMKMDDVLDGLEQWVARLEMYSITDIDEYMIKFFAHIHQSSIEIAKAIDLLASKRLLDIRPHAIQIKDFESRCDELLRTSIKNLFVVEKDPIKIIQVKELYEMLEGIADSCEDVANTLETIIMRNA
ncbi:putative phosphate transport protein (TIGR00153 family) [Bacillus fengqiuensis]|nr:putative phosphate transport protein (TIGR00153 family) [Bacillus fengqiuensis]